MKNKALIVSWMTLVIALSGCALQFIASYDQQTLQQIEHIDQEVERLYLDLTFTPIEDRKFDRFAKQYQAITLQIRSLERRQKRREKNTESLEQTRILLSLWVQDEATHRKNDTISNFIINRRTSQYRRLFDALIDGELAKQ
ncbi:conserved hypothetical protein [Vibrio nigripulchritudo SFn27]|uniref:Death domain-containing protein n=2 Tax=Vibrio nigripulchritudo TaxID=28173 RepID=U4K904_9VIBR|nr:hypothetical protein [Vibrio nigripulchritudo]CCN35344.1 conserved hypothetical protein [Vibrio nigripulchritudo AM115]CCN42657.1 conserved hypothetical protein [Vibrio nigripulchritudo FTn2]CCN63116.1 conserved hypothetical protein [Vibrio nigripulchritudo POn4]CCN77321.1 conserved hypothetical protein [Vibrio nigripulchritudo SO65]CCN80540.1 conserved hypothetical protein [Vibrio nigripulchritudo BLFn1]